MYTDPGFWSLIIAAIVGAGLTPFFIFRTKIKEWWANVRRKKQL